VCASLFSLAGNGTAVSSEPNSGDSPPLHPGNFVVLRPHPNTPPEALFVARISSESLPGDVQKARPWVPKLGQKGDSVVPWSPWRDTWMRKWVPYGGGEFEVDKDDVIVSWASQSQLPEAGAPIPASRVARGKEILAGGVNLPAPKYPSWVSRIGEILSAEEWAAVLEGRKGEGGKAGNGGLAQKGGREIADVVREMRSAKAEGGSDSKEGIEGTTFFWGGVARVDVLEVNLVWFRT
jgi:hypothetical protein